MDSPEGIRVKDEVFLVCGYHDSDMRPGALIVVYILLT
jgi:hypothetical protein